MRYSIQLALASLSLIAAPSAQAGVGTVEFTGNVLTACTIALGTAGLLDVSADGQVLSTRTGLGRPALAVVTATGTAYRIGVSTPSAFLTAPNGANSGVTFETRYSTTGVTGVTDILSGTTTLLSAGITNLSVNLIATRQLGFPAGPYVAQSTVTCE